MELNPNHPVTIAVRDQWHAIAALLMKKLGTRKTLITLHEIDHLAGYNIAIKETEFGLEVFLLSDAEAHALARKEGGLPV